MCTHRDCKSNFPSTSKKIKHVGACGDLGTNIVIHLHFTEHVTGLFD